MGHVTQSFLDKTQRHFMQIVRGTHVVAVLYEWDWHWTAHYDREDGLFGLQLSNRTPVVDGRVSIENPQPGQTWAHLVIEVNGRPIVWTAPHSVGPGDVISFDVRENLRFG